MHKATWRTNVFRNDLKTVCGQSNSRNIKQQWVDWSRTRGKNTNKPEEQIDTMQTENKDCQIPWLCGTQHRVLRDPERTGEWGWDSWSWNSSKGHKQHMPVTFIWETPKWNKFWRNLFQGASETPENWVKKTTIGVGENTVFAPGQPTISHEASLWCCVSSNLHF